MISESAAPVLVVGAGPSGLVAALALLQNDVPIRIIDKELQYPIGQRGNAIWHRTFEVFHFLRVHEIHQKAAPMLPIREYNPGTVEPTKTFLMYPFNDPTPSIPYNNPRAFGQPALEAILRSRLEKYGCSVELGTALESFEDDGERVLAKLVKRKDGEEVSETFEAAFIIGADGARGITRKQLGLTFVGETREDFITVVGDICVEVEGVDRNHWHFFGHRSANFCMLRPTDLIAPDGFNFVMTAKDYDPARLIADHNLLFQRMSALIGREVKVSKVVFLSEFRPNVRMVDKFGRGRVFIAGDAAHIHSPTGGQGLNAGVQDAFNLAWKVSLVHKGLSPVTLLDTYTTERLPVIAEMLNITTGILNKMLNSSTIEDSVKREKRLNMLGVNCRASPIVVDEYTQAEPISAYEVLDEGVLVAGDRAPDAPGLVLAASGVKTTLFDVFSPTYHTVLVFASDASSTMDVLGVVKRYPENVTRSVIILPQGSEAITAGEVDVAVDHNGHAYRTYLAVEGEQKVVVVRPDGVTGAIARGAEGVEAYFGKIFI